jgi:K+-transporting ATPase KdpF subunit
VTVDWTTTLALVVAVLLVVYLTVALLKPELFS